MVLLGLSALFENDGLKFGIPERKFQLSRKSVRAVSLWIESNELRRKKIDHSVLRGKLQHSLIDVAECYKSSFQATTAYGQPLSFTNIFAALIEEFSSQLRSIEWNCGRTLGDCLPHPDTIVCTNIRELEFQSSLKLIPF